MVSMINEAENDVIAQPVMLVFDRSAPSRKKLLFLDDRPARILKAQQRFSDFEVTFASNVRETLRALAGDDFHEVWLENDLQGEDFLDPNAPWAGMEVVRYIQTTGWPPNKPKPFFRVHTSNVFAAYLMVHTLQGLGMIAVFQPFDEEAT